MWPSLFKRLQERRAIPAREQTDRRAEHDGMHDDSDQQAAPPNRSAAAVQLRNTHHHGVTTQPPESQQGSSSARPHLSRHEGRRRFASDGGRSVPVTRDEGHGADGDASASMTLASNYMARSSEAMGAQSASSSTTGSTDEFSINGDGTNKKPPAAVKNAIAEFPVISGLTLKPPSDKETSYIYKWGVRVEIVEDGKPAYHWICLADESCRRQGTNFTLSSGRTSKPANHLASVHGVVSLRTLSHKAEKRERQDEIEHLRSSPLFVNNPRRFGLLVEACRIIYNNLPFRFGEYKESRIIETLLKKEEVQVVINAAKVNKVIVELYSSTKSELISILADTHKKYIGVRVYFVDANWEFRSLLLGVRRFSPSYGDREGGIQGPYKAWILQLLGDFGLTAMDFYGATSDGAPDVKNLLKNKLNLKWEWCMAHLAHAATREACGMNGDVECSRNPHMTDLISRIKKTITDVHSVEKTGDLFSALCNTRTSTSTTQLVSYAANRFLSITGTVRRILDKWNALVEWYDTRGRLVGRRNQAPPSFRLRNRLELEQILSLLEPISSLKRLCQAEKPNQVEVLMELYQIRLDTVCLTEPLEDYRSERKSPRWIAIDDLTPLAMSTRRLLRDAFDTRFFFRYTTDAYLDEGDFVFEMQQRLHPEYNPPQKSLNTVIRQLYVEKDTSSDAIEVYISRVNEAIVVRLRDLMKKIFDPAEDNRLHQLPPDDDDDEVPFSRIRERFGGTSQQPPLVQPDRVAQDLRRWEVDPVEMRANENVLDFWKRMDHSGAYIILPKVAKVLFALPSSSAQIERDFSVCGDMVTSHRSRISKENVDMCAFLNRNEEFVDIAQCEAIPDAELDDHIPQCVCYDMEATPHDVEDEMLLDLFSQTSVEEEEAG